MLDAHRTRIAVGEWAGRSAGGIAGEWSGHAPSKDDRRRSLRKGAACTGLLLALGAGARVDAQATDWCSGGVWADAMIASYHVHPKQSFDDLNPGLGVECWLNGQWALTAGGFRNSLSRPSWYGGGVWAPEFGHWGFVRLGVMGGIISGYNYGNWGIGHDHTIGPVAAPIVMITYKRVGANFILVPPIPSQNLPLTIGFQLRVRF